MRPLSIIYFVEGATDPIAAKGVRYVPIAEGPEHCDTKVSCFHLAPGARMTRAPCYQDGVLLVVQGRLIASSDSWADAEIDFSGGMGAVLRAGEALRVKSDEGAIVVMVEAPRLGATSQGISTPQRIMGQTWPGERPPRETLHSRIRSTMFWLRFWRLGLRHIRAGRRVA
jgi:hypothetical protein